MRKLTRVSFSRYVFTIVSYLIGVFIFATIVGECCLLFIVVVVVNVFLLWFYCSSSGQVKWVM